MKTNILNPSHLFPSFPSSLLPLWRVMRTELMKKPPCSSFTPKWTIKQPSSSTQGLWNRQSRCVGERRKERLKRTLKRYISFQKDMQLTFWGLKKLRDLECNSYSNTNPKECAGFRLARYRPRLCLYYEQLFSGSFIETLQGFHFPKMHSLWGSSRQITVQDLVQKVTSLASLWNPFQLGEQDVIATSGGDAVRA